MLLVGIFSVSIAQEVNVISPNGRVKAKVQISKEDIRYSVQIADEQVIVSSPIAMILQNGTVLGKNPKLAGGKKYSVNRDVPATFYRKSTIKENYTEWVLNFKGDYKLVFRAYNNGVAYRFETNFKDSVVVKNEIATFAFAEDFPAIVPYVNYDRQTEDPISVLFETSYENTYTKLEHISQVEDQKLVFLPAMVMLPSGRKVVITESDLRSYPGMYLQNQHETAALNCLFAPYPIKVEQGGHNNLQYRVKERADYIAKTAGQHAFPWRVIALSEQDKDLVDNDLVYLLASPSQIEDCSWIKPGKVAWDWWNNWNIWGVDFKAGINNETYKYYIDFAAKSGIEYVILDEGWAVNKQADLFQVVPEIDLPELVKYGQSKGVGIVLWAGYAAMDKEMERVCQHYAEMGVKGFKVDFMDRDDQVAVEFYERMAATAAKYHLFIDFHGAYKPTGLNRTYPNVLNYEGVFGLEQCKWMSSEVDMPTYDVTIPFIRMLAGPLDYTQGAMRNASKGNYAPVWSDPMSMGTRCHQLAEYVVFDAPFSMLCDAPTAYLQESECTEFIADVPTVWDETKILDGKVGEYVVTAKRKGDKWYVGALTNWTSRTLDIDLKELGTSASSGTAYVDGPNAHRKGCDYQKKSITVPSDGRLAIELAPGGGAVIIL